MSKSKNNASSLLAAIQRKAPPEAPLAIKEPDDAKPHKPKKVHVPRDAARHASPQTAKRRIGKAVQFWFHDEDRKLVRELAAWLAGQGERPTDSLVVRAALRMADTGGEFLAAYRKALSLDGRLKPGGKE